MSEIAIKTEKLDDEQEEIVEGSTSRAAELEADAEVVNDEEREREWENTRNSNNYTAGKWRRTMEHHNSQKVLRMQQQQHHHQLQQQQHQQQQRSLQSTTLTKSSNNSNRIASSSGRALGYSHQRQPIIKPPYDSKSLCGEVFVSNNARQWTFICTYCNKSTRDIGEFICHIKVKHLGGFGSDDGDLDDTASQQSYENEQDQSFLDCGNYLDVNVHTEPEDCSSFNGLETQYGGVSYENASDLYREQQQAAASSMGNKKKSSSSLLKQLNAQKNVIMMNDDEKPANSYNEPEVRSTKRCANDQFDDTRVSKKVKQSLSTITSSTPYATGKRVGSGANGSFDQMPLAYGDNACSDMKDDDQDTNNPYAPYENDDNKDFDNQLLITPTESFDASASYAGEMKTKRRQIRGTAYCALCDKTFQYYSLYRNHMIKHSNETPFKCSLCKKGFKSKQAIRYHMNTHDKDKQFKCSLCYASYTTENQFITHVLTHEDENTFPCMVCGTILQSEKERDFHLTGHTEERPFRCEFCNKLFKLRHHLSNHLKLHRQYRCDSCREEFTSASYQRKPYFCPACEKSAERKEPPKSGTPSGGADVNPLQLFETVLTPGQQESNDYAEMVTDSEDEDKAEQIDDEQDHEEDQDNEDQDENQDDDESEADEEENDDEDVEYVKGKSATTVASGGNASRYDNASYAKNVNAPKTRYACKYCPSNYSHLGFLKHHLRTKHC